MHIALSLTLHRSRRKNIDNKVTYYSIRPLYIYILFRYCLPYFKKAQNHELAKPGDPFRGDKGPLHVMQGKCDNPLHKAFIESGAQQGIGYTEDMNGYRQEGTGPMDMTIRNGKRWSTSQAYLWPVRWFESLLSEFRQHSSDSLTPHRTALQRDLNHLIFFVKARALRRQYQYINRIYNKYAVKAYKIFSL